jgi:hypothetical protein
MRCSRPITAALTGSGVVIAAVHLPLLQIGAGLTILLVYLGVVLPAVWSTSPARRRDARCVLRLLITSSGCPARHDTSDT